MGFRGINAIIDQAFNGEEALDMVKKGCQKQANQQYCYGLIFMDCSMPIVDGYDASDNIRAFLRSNNMPQPVIIACTGHTEEEFIQKAWRHKMDEVVAKPTNFDILKEILSEMIEH